MTATPQEGIRLGRLVRKRINAMTPTKMRMARSMARSLDRLLSGCRMKSMVVRSLSQATPSTAGAGGGGVHSLPCVGVAQGLTMTYGAVGLEASRGNTNSLDVAGPGFLDCVEHLLLGLVLGEVGYHLLPEGARTHLGRHHV